MVLLSKQLSHSEMEVAATGFPFLNRNKMFNEMQLDVGSEPHLFTAQALCLYISHIFYFLLVMQILSGVVQ